MNDEKKFPTARISFSEKQLDEQGREKLGRPVEVATIWPRENGKQGGIIQWHISPKNLGEGVYFHLENERQNRQSRNQEKDAFDRADETPQGRDTGLSR